MDGSGVNHAGGQAQPGQGQPAAQGVQQQPLFPPLWRQGQPAQPIAPPPRPAAPAPPAPLGIRQPPFRRRRRRRRRFQHFLGPPQPPPKRGRPFGDGISLFFKFLRHAVDHHDTSGHFEVIHGRQMDGSNFFVKTKVPESLHRLRDFYNEWKRGHSNYVKNATTESVKDMLRHERRIGTIRFIRDTPLGQIFAFTGDGNRRNNENQNANPAPPAPNPVPRV